MKGRERLCVVVGTLLFATTVAAEKPQGTERLPSRDAVFSPRTIFIELWRRQAQRA